MPKITRKICTFSFEVIRARFLAFPCRTTLSPGTETFRGFSSVSVCVCAFWSKRGPLCFPSTIGSVAETTGVSFWTRSRCFPLIAFSHFLFYADCSPFVTLDQYSCFNPFILGFLVAGLNHLIKVSSHQGLQSLIAWHWSISINFFFVKSQYGLTLNRISYFSTCTNLPGYFLWVFHLMIIELGPILYRNPEHHLRERKHWKDLTGLELHRKLQLLENGHRSCKQSASLVEICRVQLFFGSADWRGSSSVQTLSSHQAFQHRGNRALQLTATS